MKTCSACRVNKDESEFYHNAAQRDGLTNQCMVCHRLHQARYREQGREARRQATARWRQRNPDYKQPQDRQKVNARIAIAQALADGKITRPEHCACCGQARVLQAHHHRGYAKEHRLDVLWLCIRCHGFAHRKSA